MLIHLNVDITTAGIYKCAMFFTFRSNHQDIPQAKHMPNNQVMMELSRRLMTTGIEEMDK